MQIALFCVVFQRLSRVHEVPVFWSVSCACHNLTGTQPVEEPKFGAMERARLSSWHAFQRSLDLIDAEFSLTPLFVYARCAGSNTEHL